MIVLLIIGVTVLVGVALLVAGKVFGWDGWGTRPDCETAGICTIAVGLILAIFAAIILFCSYVGADAYRAMLETRYESLSYQWNNDFYSTEYEIGRMELVKQIREWNEDLAASKKLQRNVWIGAFIPNIYDEFEFIPLEKGGKG